MRLVAFRWCDGAILCCSVEYCCQAKVKHQMLRVLSSTSSFLVGDRCIIMFRLVNWSYFCSSTPHDIFLFGWYITVYGGASLSVVARISRRKWRVEEACTCQMAFVYTRQFYQIMAETLHKDVSDQSLSRVVLFYNVFYLWGVVEENSFHVYFLVKGTLS